MNIVELQKAIADLHERLAAINALSVQDDTQAVSVGGDGIFIELADLRDVLDKEALRLTNRLDNYEKAMDAANEAIVKSLRDAQW